MNDRSFKKESMNNEAGGSFRSRHAHPDRPSDRPPITKWKKNGKQHKNEPIRFTRSAAHYRALFTTSSSFRALNGSSSRVDFFVCVCACFGASHLGERISFRRLRWLRPDGQQVPTKSGRPVGGRWCGASRTRPSIKRDEQTRREGEQADQKKNEGKGRKIKTKYQQRERCETVQEVRRIENKGENNQWMNEWRRSRIIAFIPTRAVIECCIMRRCHSISGSFSLTGNAPCNWNVGRRVFVFTELCLPSFESEHTR